MAPTSSHPKPQSNDAKEHSIDNFNHQPSAVAVTRFIAINGADVAIMMGVTDFVIVVIVLS